MPLTTCPDCAQQVSDRAPTCPACGAPISVRVQMVAHSFWQSPNVGAFAVLIFVIIVSAVMAAL